jgi:hypothetical protein
MAYYFTVLNNVSAAYSCGIPLVTEASFLDVVCSIAIGRLLTMYSFHESTFSCGANHSLPWSEHH